MIKNYSEMTKIPLKAKKFKTCVNWFVLPQ